MATILLADDNSNLTHLLTILLENRGHKVLAVHDGISVVKVLRENHVDLVLLDMVLPAINGWEILDWKAADPTAPKVLVIIVSGYTRIDLPIPEGVAGVYDKADPIEHLLELIDRNTQGL